MGSSGLLLAKYVGRQRSDDGVGPLPAYAPHDGHEEHGQTAAAVTERGEHGAGDRADCGRRLGRGQPKHRYGGLHLISQLTPTGDGPWFGVCCASARAVYQ